MPDIEFLSEGRDSGPDEDVLGGDRRPFPKWLIALVLAVLAAGAVTVALAHRGGGTHRAAAPSLSPSLSPSPSSSAPATTFGSPLDVGHDSYILDVAMSDDSLWVLTGTRLTGQGLVGRNISVPVPNLHLSTAGSAHLVVDVGAARLWVVVEGMARSRVLEYDAFTLRLIRSVSFGAPLSSAVALDGSLYAATGSAILRLESRGLTKVAGVAQSIGQLVADPGRLRLLVLDIGMPTSIWTYRPGDKIVQPAGNVPLTKATAVVVNGAIWVGGFSNLPAKIERLDPETFAVIGASGLSTHLGPGALLVAGGVSAFWVRDGSASQALWCVDAASGEPRQYWQLSGSVASTRNGALVGTTSGAIPLVLSGCKG